MNSSTLSPSCLAHYYYYSVVVCFIAIAIFIDEVDITLLDITFISLIKNTYV